MLTIIISKVLSYCNLGGVGKLHYVTGNWQLNYQNAAVVQRTWRIPFNVALIVEHTLGNVTVLRVMCLWYLSQSDPRCSDFFGPSRSIKPFFFHIVSSYLIIKLTVCWRCTGQASDRADNRQYFRNIHILGGILLWRINFLQWWIV
jgi:hypothetical protein